MEKSKWPAIGGLILGTLALTREIPTTFAFDKPLLSSIIFLASAAATFALGSRFLFQGDGSSTEPHRYDALPLNGLGEQHASHANNQQQKDTRFAASLRKLRIGPLLLVGAICVRVQISVRVLGNVQCSGATWEPLIPLIFACLDTWSAQRHSTATEAHILRARNASLTAVVMFAFGGIIAMVASRSPSSTYICATSLNLNWMTSLLQRLGTVLDFLIVYYIARPFERRSENGRSENGASGRVSQFKTLSSTLLRAAQVSALIWLGTGAVYFVVGATPVQRKRFLEIPGAYIWSVLRLNVILCITMLCAFVLIFHVGWTTVTMIPTFVSIYAASTAYSWENTLVFPSMGSGWALFGICLAIFGLAMYIHLDASADESNKPLFRRGPVWLYFVLLILIAIRASLWSSSSAGVHYHPIDLLIYEAQGHHDTYAKQSSTSRTIEEAVKTYRQRYGRAPPPGFDHWYQYATARNSAIIDDFDSIHRDILPFYALSPEQIRHRTWEMVSNQWHDASGLVIRGGKIEIAPNVMPTHRWMLSGIVTILEKFAEHLPDMDLAFNMNDECRVAVPHEEIERMRQLGSELAVSDGPGSTFSPSRADGWTPILEDSPAEKAMKELSWQKTFYEFGTNGCPPGSPALNERLWNVQRLCTSCIEPHSIGSFLSNWTLAADICHQPDLASLHGFYIAPAAFKATSELYPVFSQSKAYGYNDILYPSAWNYADKVKYDPDGDHPATPYSQKNATLFWRGGTTEGVSDGLGNWKGMSRQRFINLANDVSSVSRSQTLLLPSFSGDQKGGDKSEQTYQYSSVPVSTLTKLMATDVHVVKDIARCRGFDCTQQAWEFAPLVEPTDFQAHWQYKFLLDMDGAGFSGRFLSFLSSHSLPMKAALFREWWDDRVTPWQHFVPLDLRGHGFWATLAYFSGLDGKINGKQVRLEPHEKQGERIADSGREWANKVLRKEDMEIYFFRLLLEWGRLTDDNRDRIGFHLDVG